MKKFTFLLTTCVLGSSYEKEKVEKSLIINPDLNDKGALQLDQSDNYEHSEHLEHEILPEDSCLFYEWMFSSVNAQVKSNVNKDVRAKLLNSSVILDEITTKLLNIKEKNSKLLNEVVRRYKRVLSLRDNCSSLLEDFESFEFMSNDFFRLLTEFYKIYTADMNEFEQIHKSLKDLLNCLQRSSDEDNNLYNLRSLKKYTENSFNIFIVAFDFFTYYLYLASKFHDSVSYEIFEKTRGEISKAYKVFKKHVKNYRIANY